MKFRVLTDRHVLQGTALITALSIAVPTVLVGIILWHLPLPVKAPYLLIAAGIPLFIAAPISYFAMKMLRTINVTVDAVNNLVKYDALTQVLCRSYFYQLWRENRRKGGFLAIIDADRFKQINDTYGHDVGDEALKHIAEGLSRTVPQDSIIGRLGGEEFAVFVPRIPREQAKLLASEICTWFRNVPMRYGTISLNITVSIGLTFDNADEQIGMVMRRADKCLYAAKAQGRDRYVQEIELDAVAKAA